MQRTRGPFNFLNTKCTDDKVMCPLNAFLSYLLIVTLYKRWFLEIEYPSCGRNQRQTYLCVYKILTLSGSCTLLDDPSHTSLSDGILLLGTTQDSYFVYRSQVAQRHASQMVAIRQTDPQKKQKQTITRHTGQPSCRLLCRGTTSATSSDRPTRRQ